MFQFMFMVQLLVKFKFFIQELWERKSLQILYECWRRAYHVLLAQLFIKDHKTINSNNYAKFEVNWPRGSQFTVWHTKNRLQFDE
jgi:hypothetical protein